MSLTRVMSFYGGKFRAAKKYPYPLYQTIIEPFAGGAGYSLRHGEKRKVILIEKDPVIVAVWRYVQKTSAREILRLPMVRDGESVRDLKIPQEAQWLIGFWLNNGIASPAIRPCQWMRLGTRPAGFWGHATRARLAAQAGKINHWEIIEGDYMAAPDINATWFIDPPYQVKGDGYVFASVDYEKLAAWCRARSGQIIVCEQYGARWLPFQRFKSLPTGFVGNRTGRSLEVWWYALRKRSQTETYKLSAAGVD